MASGPSSSGPPDPVPLWPTWVVRRSHPDPRPLNRALKKLFDAHMEKDGGRSGGTYASTDDLLDRYGKKRAIQDLFGFLSDTVFQVAHAANEAVWAELGAPRVRVMVAGAWFQVQNDGGRHGIHNHGNASWSGVYYVDVDPGPERIAHPRYGASNGVTRFHGPHLARLGGAHMDLGSAYLQRATWDVAPAPGTAVVFPSWLLHEVLPYEGARDRVIVSFNAQLQPQGGSAGLPFGF